MNTDSILQDALYLINLHRQFYFDITLTVKGTIITGQLVSERLYLEQWTHKLHKVDGYNLTRKIRVTTTDQKDEIETKLTAFRQEHKGLLNDIDSQIQESSLFIHIRNAQIKAGDGQVIEYALWRGVISSIDGYVLGELQVLPEELI